MNEIKKELHTKLPWILFRGKNSDVIEIQDKKGRPIIGWSGFDDSRRSLEEHEANAAFIVESVTEIDALKTALAEAEKLLDQAAEMAFESDVMQTEMLQNYLDDLPGVSEGEFRSDWKEEWILSIQYDLLVKKI